MDRYKKSGWYKESQRHSLAAKGVKTGRNKNPHSGALIGAGTGVLVGGVTGGPPGAVVGGVLGGAFGHGASSKNKVAKKPDYAKLMSSKEFRLGDDYTIVAKAEDTRSGFRHVVDLYKNGQFIDTAKVTYLNRTWESYEYETAIKKLLDKQDFSDEKKNKFLEITSGKAHKDIDDKFKSIAMVASLGEVFGGTKKEKNDWKARMVKAGLGGKGLDMPDDWDALSEDEKEKRLNMVIKHLKGDSK